MNMTSKSILFLGFSSLLVLTGCASNNQPYQYNDKESRALNIYKAAGLEGIVDTKVPEDVYHSITGGSYALANGIVNYNSAAFLNLSSWSAFGLGFLSVLTSGSSDPNLNGVIAWMPTTLANNEEQAIEVMEQLFYDATKNVADKHNLILKMGPTAYGYTLFLLNKADNQCKTTSDDPKCWFSWGVKLKSTNLQPSFLNNKTTDSYFFSKKDSSYFIAESPIMDKFQFLKELSVNLPDWVAFYYAPERYSKEKTAPLIINKGEMLYFVTPEDTVN